LAHGAVETLVLDYLDVGAMARFFDAKKHGDLQKQATTESDSFFQIKAQIYANLAPRFERAAAPHQSNKVLALTTAILLFKLGYAAHCRADGVQVLGQLGEIWLDLAPFAAARWLLAQGYDPDRLLVVHLEGADHVMARAPLGAVAATPLVNTAKPVKHGTLEYFREMD
jgi:hypothetical protein